MQVASRRPKQILSFSASKWKLELAVVIDNTGETLRMADVVNVIGDDKNPKVPWSFQVTYVDDYVTNWVNADLVTHNVPGT